VGVSAVDLLLSRTGSGGPFDPLATGIANSGSFDWTVTGPPTIDAFLKVIAYDAASHSAFDVSDTAFVITDNVGVEGEGPPAQFALGRFSPHPVHGVAHIRFDVPRAATIHLSVFDMQGREVAVLADGPWEAGRHQLDWRSASAPPGLYFVRYATPGHSFVRRLVRVR